MDAVELIERSIGEDNEFDVPDNIIHIVFPESPKLNDPHDEDSLITNPQQNDKPLRLSSDSKLQGPLPGNNVPLLDKNLQQCKIKTSCEKSYKIMISTNAKTNNCKRPQMDSYSIESTKVRPPPPPRAVVSCFCEVSTNTERLFEKLQTSQNAQTQTAFLECAIDKMENLNLFYCTFHQDGDVETYCNIANSFARNLNVNETSDSSCTVKQSKLEFVIPEVNTVTSHEGTRLLAAEEASLERRKRKRRTKIVRDLPSQTDLEVTVEELAKEDQIAKSSVSRLTDKGYLLRTQRLYKKFNDMQYTFRPTTKKRKNSFGAMKCMHCSEEFATFCRLEKHSKLVHNSSEFSFPCDLCQVTFTRPHNLRRHRETKHREGEKKYRCEYCGRGFNRQDILASHTYLIHSRIHLKYKRFSNKKRQIHHCSSCDRYFSRIQNFKNHQKGNLTCPKCPRAFACRTGLRNHLYKEHSVACCICEMVCANKQQLYFHKLSHSPKFRCKYCNKGFILESQFIVHLATHTGNKPLSCEICGKCFAHKNAVNKHKWQEHTEANKRFPCKVCGKSFAYKAKLDSHLRSHTGEKPFACHLCPSTFSENCNLSAHIKSVHGIFLQSVKKDEEKRNQEVKYKKGAKKVLSKSSGQSATSSQSLQRVSVVSLQMAQPQNVKPVPRERVLTTNSQVYPSEAFSEPFNHGNAVYQILYAYPM